MSNPYSLTFGQPPLEMIERRPQIESIVNQFCSETPSNHINLITGIRGSGKTVFMTEVSDRIRQRSEWVVIHLNPQRDLLTSMAAKLNSDKVLNGIFKAAEINLSFFGIGVGIKTAPLITDIEEALTRMLNALRKQGKRVLITVDEASNTREMRIFASSFQIFLRERLPVFLLMTGLYKNIDSLRNADGMTFLERAPRTVMSPLNQERMVSKYMETLHIKEHQAFRLAKATCGYSFAFQTIGYFYYEDGEEARTLADAREYLFEFAYRKIWSELSPKDKTVLAAAARVRTGSVAEIREILNFTSNQFNPYRDRLIKAGVLISNATGYLEWALPFYDEFALAMTPEQHHSEF